MGLDANCPPIPINTAKDDLLTFWRESAVDLDDKPLLVSSESALGIMLESVMGGNVRPQDTPCILEFGSTNAFKVVSVNLLRDTSDALLHFYVVIHDAKRDKEFERRRDEFIDYLLRWIEQGSEDGDDGFGMQPGEDYDPTIWDFPQKNFQIVVDNDTPLRFLGPNAKPAANFYVTRIDIPIVTFPHRNLEI